MSKVRVASPAIVERMAEVNHVPADRRHAFASVVLGDVLYFWTAA